MTKRIRAKHKIDRRLGENIWGRPKSPLNKRESRPGQHGERRMGKTSDYGQQLKAKQKLKGYYGNITEKQFKAIYHEASRLKGDTSERLIGLLERRLASQPIGEWSCGSVFTNPPGDHAARLIETAGLKGFSVGDAAVSTKHANFIINRGHARAADIEAVIHHVQETVARVHGVRLQTEVRILGETA